MYEMLSEKVDEKTARAVSEAIEYALEENEMHQLNVLATKQDLRGLEVRFTTEMAELRVELNDKISASKTEMIRWMFLFWIGQVAVMAALFAYFK